MNKYFKKARKDIASEIKSHSTIYILLTTILLLALFVRVYRTEDLLGFYYDQGRDAKVIWKLWHEGRPFLIGPVTGLPGIFLGPLYYYLIAPFYLIGGGNPAVPAIFLATLATVAIYFLYFLGWKMHARTTGLIAATVGAFSLELVKAGRWLANPTPILLTSMLLLLSLWKIAGRQDKKWWMAAAVLIGISLHFEAASAVYYLPVVLVFALWQRKNLPNKKIIFISAILFLATLLPQIAFNFRHENILLNSFKRVLFEEKSFSLSFWEVLRLRFDFFWSVFHSKLLPNWSFYAAVFTLIVVGVLAVEKKPENVNIAIKLLLIFLVIPMLGFITFQGNFGNIYDYYMTGYYLPMILLFAIGLGLLWKGKAGKLVMLTFFILFFVRNASLLRYYLIAGVDGPEHITLGNELQAVNWVFEDAKKQACLSNEILRQAQDEECTPRFNVDIYVPPVIPHSYDYLFLWQGTLRQAQGKPGCKKKLCGIVLDEQVPLLYTLYEVDPPHPWRLAAWHERQAGIGEVQEEVSFGGITVQRRQRL